MKRIAEIEDNNRFFDLETSKRYMNEVRNASLVRYRPFINMLKKLNVQGNYLDVGCGPAVLTQHIAKELPDINIVGIDNSVEMLTLASQEIPENMQSRIRLEYADACNPDIVDQFGSFDFIFSTFTMHHWSNTIQAIRNLYQMLKPEAYLYIYDLKRVFWLYYLPSNSGFYRSIRASYRPNELEAMLTGMNIYNYTVKTEVPFFMQSLLIQKKPF